VATYSKIKGDTALYLPVGTIMPWSKANVPAGFLYCDGSSVSRTLYADLFAVISTTFGSVDSNNFNLPDFQDRSAIGASNNRAFASKNSAALAGQTPNITFASASVSVTSNHNIATANQDVPIPAHSHFTFNSTISNATLNSANLTTSNAPFQQHRGQGSDWAYMMADSGSNASVGKTSVTGGNSNGSHAHAINGSVTSTFNQSNLAANASAVDIENPYLAIRYMIKF
jgi:microcystin-dependent protein